MQCDNFIHACDGWPQLIGGVILYRYRPTIRHDLLAFINDSSSEAAGFLAVPLEVSHLWE